MIRTAQPRADVCAAILCGGASRRMGVPKAGLLLPDGRSMIETIRDALEAICEQVVLVGNPHGLRGHRVVEDEQPESGPLAVPGSSKAPLLIGAGIVLLIGGGVPLAGIEALLRSGAAERYLVVPCDMPAIAPGTLGRLMDEQGGPVVHFEGQPLPCLVESVLSETTTGMLADGVRALRDWQKKVDARQLDPGGILFEDADTPEEFIRLWRQFMDRAQDR